MVEDITYVYSTPTAQLAHTLETSLPVLPTYWAINYNSFNTTTKQYTRSLNKRYFGHRFPDTFGLFNDDNYHNDDTLKKRKVLDVNKVCLITVRMMRVLYKTK